MKFGGLLRKNLDARKARVRKRRVVKEALAAISPDLVVKHGPFKGLRYPQASAICGPLVPRLLGSYEAELHPVLETLCCNRYTDIVNIGCAEGYYAVGLALRFPEARVHAFDTNAEALRLCREMATCNGVGERLLTGAFCDTQTLLSIPMRGKGLIVCDCEGYEKVLFTVQAAEELARHDLIIEAHDCIDIEITTYLSGIFGETHDVEVVQSIDDIQKAKTYDYDEIRRYDLATRKLLVRERRPGIMEWLVARSTRGE